MGIGLNWAVLGCKYGFLGEIRFGGAGWYYGRLVGFPSVDKLGEIKLGKRDKWYRGAGMGAAS